MGKGNCHEGCGSFCHGNASTPPFLSSSLYMVSSFVRFLNGKGVFLPECWLGPAPRAAVSFERRIW
jgi:hypothetical protein